MQRWASCSTKRDVNELEQRKLTPVPFAFMQGWGIAGVEWECGSAVSLGRGNLKLEKRKLTPVPLTVADAIDFSVSKSIPVTWICFAFE